MVIATTMKALTLSQPWATLFVSPSHVTGVRLKTIESRSWRPPFGTMIQRQRIAIHAGKNVPADVREAISDGVLFREPYRQALIDCGYTYCDPWNPLYESNLGAQNEARIFAGRTILRSLPRGAIVGIATFTEIVSGSEIIRRHDANRYTDLEMALGEYNEDAGPRFGWVSESAAELAEPIAVRGFRKLWEWEVPAQLITRNADIFFELGGKP
jgi:hypothetical protein